MMDDILKICDTCGAFGPQLDHDQMVESEDDGACRLHPPQFLTSGDGYYSLLFPGVNREDWCRSWIPREDDD